MTDAYSPLPLPKLLPREATGHKGTYGKAVIIGGSVGMSGAVMLSGMSALRGGAGLVQLAVPKEILPIVAGYEPSYMTVPLAMDEQGKIDGGEWERVRGLCESATAVAVGPGLGRSKGLTDLVRKLFETLPQTLVLDADALNALAEIGEPLKHAGPRILTPHPGEFGRLLKCETGEIQQQRISLALSFARQWQVVLVLKGHQTVVTDGEQLALNETGNPGMATGGSGDVLTGLVAALTAQGWPALQAARLGVHWHGLAGDLAAEELGQPSMIASDLVRFLPLAFQRLG